MHLRSVSLILFALAITMTGAFMTAAPAQQPGFPAAVKPKPYNPVAVKPPQRIQDPTFESFRKQLSGIAERKDRVALARLVSKNFFWIPEGGDKDIAEKSKPPIETLARALWLDSPDAIGWEILGSFAAEPTGDFDLEYKGVLCGPADPDFDEKAAEELVVATDTEASDWVYPVREGIEVHAEPSPGSPVIAKLGMHLIWILPDDSPASAVQADTVRVVLPSGRMGFVSVEALLTLAGDQMCYVKEDNTWKIAGLRGGDPTNK
jgi:hypothetical protein